MKKVFALVLAVAMVLSLSAVAFADGAKVSALGNSLSKEAGAVNAIEQSLYTLDDDIVTAVNGNVAYGETVYVVLKTTVSDGEEEPTTAPALVTDNDSVSKLKVSAKWTVGGSNIKSVEIVKRKVYADVTTTAGTSDYKVVGAFVGFAASKDADPANAEGKHASGDGDKDNDEGNDCNKIGQSTGKAADEGKGISEIQEVSAYFVAITTTGSSLDETEVAGTVTLKGKTPSDASSTTTKEFTVAFTLGYPTSTVAAGTADVEVAEDLTNYDFTADKEDEVTLKYGDNVTVVIDATSEKEVLLGYDLDDVGEIVKAYSEANLDFYALTGTFKKTATVTIEADEDTYLYQVVDGKVKAVKAEYDEYEGGFVFNARTLGTYVVSDIELTAAADDAVETVVSGTTTSANPSTGAAA
jgi:hypothetical protein